MVRYLNRSNLRLLLAATRLTTTTATSTTSRRFLRLAAMAAERSCQRKFAQLMPDHVFRHKHLDVHLAVVNHERVANEFRNDRAPPRPRRDRVFDARLIHPLDLAIQLRIDVRTFFQRT